jgi:photosystem II stability/assembly factor-like uncharacterized protein
MRLFAILVALAAMLVALPIASAAEEANEALEPMRADARLSDVFFVDATHGWAVGDRGVIVHTSDGGRTWNLQNSGVDCRIATVFFLDAKIGWAAGGYTQPFTHASTGVILRTRDGGAHWTSEAKLTVPAIARIGFFDPTHGWALGHTSAVFPSGVFSTDDGGRSWSPLPSGESRGWLAGDFIDPHTGAVAGRASGLAVIRRKAIEAEPADFGLRALARMKLIAPQSGWLVGEGGLILTSEDLGKTWQTSGADLPPAIRNYFDFSALAVRGDHCWVAGTPGTRILVTDDAGETWASYDTSQSMPIHALAFPSDKVGWAVGELGTILATRDGGRTWKRQRGGGGRAAFLGFFGRMSEVPFELIAQLAGEEGYLGAMEILSRDDVEPRGGAAIDDPLAAHEASVLAGGSSAAAAWRFPLRQSAIKLSVEQLIEGWDRANDSEALSKLEAHIVARIRMWRPNMVVTSSTDASGKDPLAHLINQVVLRAVERAGDPAQHADQISEAGLQPWRVQKVYGTLPGGGTGTSSITPAQLAARLGRSIAEQAAPAKGIIADRYSPPAATVGFRLLVDHVPQELGKRDFFAGIVLQPGGDARRRLIELPDRNLDAMRREVQMRRNLQAILAQAESDARDGRFLADIGSQTKSMQPDRAAEVLFQLAGHYFATGRWDLAAECYDLVVERYPKQHLAGPALVWLVQYYASAEAAWRTRTAQQIAATNTQIQPPSAQPQQASVAGGKPQPRQLNSLVPAAHVERAGGLLAEPQAADEARAARADGYSKQLELLQPALLAEPLVRFPLAVAHRQQGLPRQAERYYAGLRHGRPHDAWWTSAQAELWLREPKGTPPKELWHCARATAKPRLDGRLDEPMWRAGNSIELRSMQRDDLDWRAVAMLAYDEEFLYLGVSCNQAPGFQYAANDQPRPRDSDLTDQDRIELAIDLDRDCVTYYRLTVDHRGWTGESCWGDRTWNPTWFVASGRDGNAWTAEVAIPLSELTGQLPQSKHAWGIGIQRVLPGVGFQSWTTPASGAMIPEGFGVAIFQ